ncbi:MAG: type II secretion system F family protein [Candidatus Omnitrophota bacterium]
MPKFNYAARDDSGKIYKGTLEVDNEAAVRAKLKDMGLYVTELNKHAEEMFTIKWEKISTEDIMVFTERFSSMVNAGIPIIKSLETIGRQIQNSTLKRIVYKVSLDLEGGERLSDALAKHPRVFSNFYVNMIRAGEAGGILDEVMKKIVEYLGKEDVLRRNIKKAFTYPLIVLCASAIVISFLVMFIVPIFAKVYSKMGITLPMPTTILMGVSKFAGHYWWAILIAIALAIFGYKRASATDEGRLAIDKMKLNLPVFGALNRDVAISRFIRTFGSLVSSGIVVTESLRIVRGITGNKVITDIIDGIQNSVREGGRITDSISKEILFPPMIAEMIAAGEEAGILDAMLQKSSDILDRDVDYAVAKLVAYLEPMLTLFLAFIVGFIALAIYLPMFDLITSMSK